jgi:hypothetical protein
MCVSTPPERTGIVIASMGMHCMRTREAFHTSGHGCGRGAVPEVQTGLLSGLLTHHAAHSPQRVRLVENRFCRVGVVAASGPWHFGELGEETISNESKDSASKVSPSVPGLQSAMVNLKSQISPVPVGQRIERRASGNPHGSSAPSTASRTNIFLA